MKETSAFFAAVCIASFVFAHPRYSNNHRSRRYNDDFLDDYDSSDDGYRHYELEFSEEEERILSALAAIVRPSKKSSSRRNISFTERPKTSPEHRPSKKMICAPDKRAASRHDKKLSTKKNYNQAGPSVHTNISSSIQANQNWSITHPEKGSLAQNLPLSSSERSQPVSTPLTTTRLQQQVNHPPHRSVSKPSSTTTPWIRRYIHERAKDVLLPIPKEYITDNFKRIGFQVLGEDAIDIAKQLSGQSYPIYRLALQLILDESNDESLLLQHPVIPAEAIQEGAEALYLMVHARFCQSPRGLDALRRIIPTESYGKCSRMSCQGSMLLPYGRYSDFSNGGQDSLCLRYCPTCGEIWNCWGSKTDGCAWGPSLCHLFLMTHGSDVYGTSTRKTMPSEINSNLSDHVVMGFRIHPKSLWGRPFHLLN